MAISVSKRENLDVLSSEEIVKVRHTTRLWSVKLGFNLVDQTKMVTASSELARNMVDFAGKGKVLLEEIKDGERKGLRMTFEDNGPGIPDIEEAMKDGYTTRDGLGLGLGGAKRLVNEFEIISGPGKGTRVTITRWK